MDGDLLTPIRIGTEVPNPFGNSSLRLHSRYMASPFWYIDDLKVHGSIGLNDKSNYNPESVRVYFSHSI